MSLSCNKSNNKRIETAAKLQDARGLHRSE